MHLAMEGPLRCLEALGRRKDWFRRSWEGYLGGPGLRGLERLEKNRPTQQKAEGLRD